MTTALLLNQVLNGLQFGVLLFLLSAGLTLVFGVMNFVNLAHGSLYMLGAYIAATLYQATGMLLPAILGMLAACLGLGVVLDRLVARPLYGRDHLYQVLATFGLILFSNEMVRMIWGNAPYYMPVPELLSGSIDLMGIAYPVYRLAIILVGLAVAGGCAFLINRTRFGMLIRAGSTNARMVGALGIDIGRLNAALFGLGAALAGLAGLMAGPLLSLQPGMGEPVLILAMVVIVIGGIGSVRGAFLASLIVGLVDTLGRALLPVLLTLVVDRATARAAGPAIASILIYCLMAAVLAFRPAGLFPVPQPMSGPTGAPTRHQPGDRAGERLGWGLMALMALVPVLGLVADQPFLVTLASRMLLFALAASGLNLALGFGGMVSFGHALYLGIGAYVVGILAHHGITSGWVHLAVTLAVCAAVALPVGAVSLRTGGIAFIMITLAFGQMGYFLFVSLKQYGGDDGLSLVQASDFGAGIDLGRPTLLYYALWLCLAGWLLVLRATLRARFGMVLRGCQSNARRMRALGFPILRYRLTGYVLSALVCGLAGLFWGNLTGFAAPSYLSWQMSGDLIVMAVLGGMGSLYGPLIGALLFLSLEEALQGLSDHWPALLGLLIVMAALGFRRGVVGLWADRLAGRGRA